MADLGVPPFVCGCCLKVVAPSFSLEDLCQNKQNVLLDLCQIKQKNKMRDQLFAIYNDPVRNGRLFPFLCTALTGIRKQFDTT